MADLQLPGATAADHAAAQTEPVLSLDGFHYDGRLLSIEEWLPHFERRVELERQLEQDQEAKRVPALRPWIEHWILYLRDVFPRRRYRFWAPDPVKLLRQLPGRGLQEHYDRFFVHQARALGWKIPSESLATTHGNDTESSIAAGTNSVPAGAGP